MVTDSLQLAQHILSDYTSKVYGQYNLPYADLTDADVKLASAIERLRIRCAQQLEVRKCTKFIKREHCSAAQLPATTSLLPTATQESIKSKKTRTPAVEVVYCMATKRNGDQCTAKVKGDCRFCGRHDPSKGKTARA